MHSFLLTTGQVAKLLQVCQGTVCGLANRGLLLSSSLPSGHRRILSTDLIAFAKAHYPEAFANQVEQRCHTLQKQKFPESCES